jgi:hypothetical protein
MVRIEMQLTEEEVAIIGQIAMDNEVETEYGRVAIINENGKKKVEFITNI